MQVLVIGAAWSAGGRRAAARKGHDVVVAEAEAAIGTVTSSRNSEVIHGGMYYPTGTLRARHCVQGRRMLYEFCASHGVGHRKCGKLVVAANAAEIAKIESIAAQGRINGVEGLELIGGNAARALEPELVCAGALLSPETGIVDSHGYMLALRGRYRGRRRRHRAQDAGGPARGARTASGRSISAAAPAAPSNSTRWSTARGFGRKAWRRAIEDYPASRVAQAGAGEGKLFRLRRRPVFSRLIYPTPIVGGLGVHVTLDLAGRMRFGPDVEWITEENYAVDPGRAAAFLRPHPHLLARAAGRLAGAGLCRHPPQAERARANRRAIS